MPNNPDGLRLERSAGRIQKPNDRGWTASGSSPNWYQTDLNGLPAPPVNAGGAQAVHPPAPS